LESQFYFIVVIVVLPVHTPNSTFFIHCTYFASVSL